MARPIGMKKATMMKKFEEARILSSRTPPSGSLSGSTIFAADINTTDRMVAKMSSATKELILAFKTATSLKCDDARMRQHEKWMKMAAMYVSCGQQDKALEMMQKIEDDDDNQRADSESAGYHTPVKEQQEQQELQ